MTLCRQLGWIACALVLTSGCPSGSGGGSAGSAGGHAGKGGMNTDAGDAGDASLDVDAGPVICPDTAIRPGGFHVDVMQVGDKKKITARLRDAMPNPPERYGNMWMLELLDGSGNPVDDAMITKAQAAMPYHGHPPKASTGITKLSDAGQFKVGIFLTMPGYFEISFDVTSASAGDDHVVFQYCLPQ